MGGTSKSSTSSQTQPWEPTIAPLTTLIGQISGQQGNTGQTPQETNAFAQLNANANSGNPYVSQISGLASNLLNGGGATDQTGAVSDAYKQLQGGLTPYLSADYLDPTKNPQIQQLLQTIQGDVSNNINGQFAAAGRDFSGMNQQTLARGIAQGEAQPLLDQYNQNQQNQLGAINSLYGAGNTTAGILSGMNQQGLTNQGAGIDAATAALQARDSAANQQLSIAQQQRQLPLQNLGALEGLLGPLAQLGQQGTSTSTQTMSPAQQAWGWINSGANVFGKLYPKGV